MASTLRAIRIFFFLLCIIGSYVSTLVIPGWETQSYRAIFIGGALGALVILTDILLKGFSLRGLSAFSFGLFMGWLAAYFITNSPLFDLTIGDPNETSPLYLQNVFLARLAVFIVLMYLGAVIALRGKDEFNLVIPYVRFVPHGVDVPLAVTDASALIDGRITGIAESKFLGHALIIPQFVLDELHYIADSRDSQRRAKGRRGLESIATLKTMPHVDLRIHESTIKDYRKVDAKIVFLAQALKAKILTTDFNLAQLAELQNVEWLNISNLAKVLAPETNAGETLQVELMKSGKEPGQAVGYLADGAMVVVEQAAYAIGSTVAVQVQNVHSSGAGKMVFATLKEATYNSLTH